MKKKIFTSVESVKECIGTEVAVSDWFLIDQDRINLFADATSDHQWIHIDQARAEKESPFKTTIAHGYLTLSLVAKFSGEVLKNEFAKMAINYGANKVRFPSPVRVNSRIRGCFLLKEVEDIDGGIQAHWTVTVEIENSDKPACVAETLTRWYF